MFDWYIRNAPIKRKLALAFGAVGTVATIATLAVWWQETAIAATLTDPGHRAALTSVADMTLGTLALELGTVSVLVMLFTRCIGTPYVTTVLRMEALARGDLDSPVQFSDYNDCVGRITRAMQTFRDDAVERHALHAAATGHRVELDSRLRASETAFEARGRDQRTIVEALARALAALASGDLAVRMEDHVSPEYERLRADFNGAMARLQDTMRTVAASAAAIRSGTGEISAASDDLSRRTEQQAASLEETAAALDEITATVRRTAEGARHARAVVGNARTGAERSGTVVRQAVDAMAGIERSSREIGQIIGVIDEIAFQTSLLALNAGVEAARAGDAGRGFAVVASEVRALAQRSAEAAKEIKALVSTSGRQVEQGVASVGQTGEALVAIVAQVAEIDGIVGEITASASEQATGLDEVNTAVNQMDQVTQQNAAMVEESTAASHALSQEAGELTRLIGEFRLGDEAEAPRSSRMSQATHRSSPRLVTMPKTIGRSGAALKVAAVTSQAWKER